MRPMRFSLELLSSPVPVDDRSDHQEEQQQQHCTARHSIANFGHTAEIVPSTTTLLRRDCLGHIGISLALLVKGIR